MQVQEFLTQLSGFLGLEQEQFSVEIEDSEDRVSIQIKTSDQDAKLLIGSQGETLQSLELLVRSVFRDEYADKKIMVDIDGYRLQREQRLLEKAVSIAQQVLETGRPYYFYDLNSYERYLIHTELSAHPELSEVSSQSEDRDQERVLVIAVKNAPGNQGMTEEMSTSELDEDANTQAIAADEDESLSDEA